ncbi:MULTISPECIES: MFS transporter [Paraburkholderia]|uniref:MFS transporter n=1 Tax=Paraburkholderia TaxID=1822464 RepID=UPI002255DBD0|nr:MULTISPECIES: MFS transporter [Paraburkholderia]MCX4161705.1 MFS transporter [Paraburkholderia megapolitana]MDN7157202.1 MFS transporter [Paraburkholderia sp. CHISQ3]MDQ6494247.1 MFS transporter [Paraburkholderia megapolitana]
MASLPFDAPDPSSTLQPGNAASGPGINARIDRLPATRTVWMLVFLLSIGGWFEFYDLFFTAYVGPGLVKSGLYATTTASFFGFSGLGAFVAASFAGLFIGTFVVAGTADRFGRKNIFTVSLLWYSIATLIMAFQTTAPMINLWRLIAGIGVGVELVTIDTYVSELMPKHLRGRAFAFVHLVQYSAVPSVAFLAWWLVPQAPFGLDGWRWVVIIGALGAIVVWAIRRRLPESPRWLAQQGRTAEASAVLDVIEARVAAQYGKPLPPPVAAVEPATTKASFREIWQPPYRRRAITMLVFNLFQAIGFYGFASWVPTLLVAKGVTITHSLLYSFVIAISNPFGPLLGMAIADRIERKTLIVLSALGIAVFGSLFATQTSPAMLMVLGVLITLSGTLLSVGYHAYQTELFPTRIRARAVGFVYSMSRLSAMFSGFMIAFALRHFETTGVFALISASMVMVMVSIGLFGPRTNQLSLDEISH